MNTQDFKKFMSKRARRDYLSAFSTPMQQQQPRESGWGRLQEQQQQSGYFAGFGQFPGLGQAINTFERAFTWGPMGLLRYVSGVISSSTVDATNTPTTTLRPGLILALVNGSWTNYSPTVQTGAQVALGVLPVGLSTINPFTQTTNTLSWGILVAGGLQAANLLGLDLFARANLAKNFVFDDFMNGIPPDNYRYPWSTFVSKTAAYQLLNTDNGTLFDNTGASGAVTFTLPAIANGYRFGFRVVANQNVTIASSEGSNMIAFNNVSASSVTFSTGGSLIGGFLEIYSDPAAAKWIVNNRSAGANTITVA